MNNTPKKSDSRQQLSQTGNGNSLIEYVDKFYNQKTVVINTGVSNNSHSPNLNNVASKGMNRNFYNLFVLGEYGEFNGNFFDLDKSRSLTDFTSSLIKEKFLPLSADTVELIKTLPAIITTENKGNGQTDESHQAMYGLITDIREVSTGYRFYYTIFGHTPVNQQLLNKNKEIFDIGGKGTLNELNRTHWSIKNIDLITELGKLGNPVMSF